MSASMELLMEQIRDQEEAIRAAAECGHDTRSMREELNRLRQRFIQASQALNENKQILKG